MDTLLLATKLRIPPDPHHAIRRLRLTDALERGIPNYRLILLSAAAGYGKTTLLAQWAHTSRFPIAWLSIDREDNDIERVLRYLLTAWAGIQPEVMQSQLGLLLGAMTPDIDAVLPAFINVADHVPDHLAFVLDDYHLIDDPAIHQTMTFLLDHLPHTIHFVLAGRTEPPLPLARYRARRTMLELHADDLQFAEEETTDFLNNSMGLALSNDAITELQTRLEGWIAGLQLAALSLQRHLTAYPLVVTGRHRFIADYLSQDVLPDLPGTVTTFLLRTSILDRLCGPLCDSVTETGGSQAMVERLDRENLFLVPLDDNREWYRYHRVFADFLHEELNRRYPGEVQGLHQRAARWYLAHDLPDPALRHAVAGADAEIATRVFEDYINVKLNTGELRTLQRWLDLLPEPWLSAYPVFGLAQAGLFAFNGALDACMHCLNQIEQRLTPAKSEQARRQLAKVIAVRCGIACMQADLAQAETYADQALRDLAEEDDSFLHLVYGALGDAYRHKGRWQEARQCYFKVLDLPHGPEYRFHSVHVSGALADLELRQGRLREAAAYWRKALAGVEDKATWGRLPLPLIGWIDIRLGEILYEWNDLEGVGEHLARGLERAELGGDVRAMIAGYLLAGRMALTGGDVAAAGEYLERVHPLVGQAAFPEWTSRYERLQLELRLAQDQLRAALRWADERLSDQGFGQRPQHEESQLAVARVLIVKGDLRSIKRALALLDYVLHRAEAEGRAGIQIEALALQALAQWRHGEHVGALTCVERALRMAAIEGYVRLFADLGLPMARLLQEARDRTVMPDYVDTLLAAFGGVPSSHIAAEAALPEPLSPREQELLQLVAAGLTNREIAEALIISLETVKKHTGSIYSKLGVRRRTEAVARARELDLLN